MRLTEEQHRLVEAAQGQPVDVVDPRTNRAYVLLPAELYQRARTLPQGAAVPAGVPPGGGAGGEPLRLKLRELPLPPEVAEEARKYCQQLGLWRRRYVQDVEDELRLQYYFGGQAVVYLRSKDGPIIVAAGRVADEAFGRQLDALPPGERRQVNYDFPSVWNDQVSQLRTPFWHQEG
jgi:hypothetical protein